jgi:S-DNA-T family DNA segregation ATPase FtsK/SpoIIIE
VHEVHAGLNSEIVEKPWLPPLEEKIITGAIKTGHDVGTIDSHNLDVPLGMADIPEDQKQIEFSHNFPEDGNFAVFGASGFGKSTTLQTIALTLASNNSPNLCQFFVMDYGNSALAQLQGLPHTADYIALDDAEKLDKLLKLLVDEMKQRKQKFASKNALNFRMYNEIAESKLPAIFLMVDNYDVVREAREDLEEFFVKLTRDGPGIGIYTVVSATRANAMKYSVVSNFKSKIALFMVEKADFTSLVGRSAYELPEVRGRALVKLADAHVAQCYLPVAHENDVQYANSVGEVIAEIAEKSSASKVSGVRVLGETVSFDELSPYFEPTKRTAWIGFDTETTEPLGLDLTIAYQIITGGAATGKTNLLRILLRQFVDNKIFISDSQAGDLAPFSKLENITYIGAASEAESFTQEFSEKIARLEEKRAESGLSPREFSASEPPTLFLIDDADAFIAYVSAKATEMEPLVKKAGELGVSFVITSMANKLKGYDAITNMFKSPQAGLVLGIPEDGALFFPLVRSPREYKPSPEIGFWFKRGDIKKIKLPFVE